MPVSPHTRYDVTKRIWERSTDGGSIWTPAYAGHYVNLLADSLFEIWPWGDAAAPGHWVVSGGAVARSVVVKLGLNSFRVAASGGTGTGYQYILSTADYDQGLDGEVFTYGGYVYAATADTVRLQFYDGSGLSYSEYHPGGSIWTWLQSSHTVDSSANQLRYAMTVNDGYTGRLSASVCLHCKEGPIHWYPSPCMMRDVVFREEGYCAVGTDYDRYDFQRPAIVRSVRLGVMDPPTVSDTIIDVNQWDGSVWRSMFSTKPRIVATYYAGEAAVDGTYQYRCFAGVFDNSIGVGRINLDNDAKGAGAPGEDLKVHVRYLQFARPWETLLGYDKTGRG